MFVVVVKLKELPATNHEDFFSMPRDEVLNLMKTCKTEGVAVVGTSEFSIDVIENLKVEVSGLLDDLVHYERTGEYKMN